MTKIYLKANAKMPKFYLVSEFFNHPQPKCCWDVSCITLALKFPQKSFPPKALPGYQIYVIALLVYLAVVGPQFTSVSRLVVEL